MKYLTAATVVVLAAACALATEPGRELPPADLPVEFHVLPFEGTSEMAFSAEGIDGGVIIRDLAATGVCHRHEDHGAYLDGDVVVFWLAHTGSLRQDCPSVGRLMPFEAIVRGLEPGEHRVRLDYIGQIDTDAYPRPTLTATVSVR